MTLETVIRLVKGVIDDLAFEVDIKAAARCHYRQQLTEVLDLVAKAQLQEHRETSNAPAIRMAENDCCAETKKTIEALQKTLASEREAHSLAIRRAVLNLQRTSAIQNEKHDEFKMEVKGFLEMCANTDRRGFKSRIGSPFSSVAKPSPRFRQQTESSFAQESKADAKNLLEYFDFHDNKNNQTPQRSNQGGSASKYSDGSLLPPRIVESAEKKGLKKNFMTFKNAMVSEEKLSERKAPQSYASELDLPDFTLECITNRDIDSQHIADQYDVGESCQRPLLHVDEQDLNDVRSLPISLKGSSTFQ